MDGRKWATIAAAGLVAAAGGCSSAPKTASGVTANLPGQGESRWAKVFGPKPPGPVAPPAPEVVAAGPKKKGISPETHVTFAKAQVDAAFLEGQDKTDSLLDEARMRYQKVLQTDPKNAEAQRGLAELYTRAGDRDRALQTYQGLVEANPKDHKAAFEMALACGRFDEWGAAVQAVEYALAIDPENRRYQKTHGKCLVWAGQPEKALEVFVKVMPEAEARYTLAKMLAEGERLDLSRQQLELALKADPSFAPAKESLARMDAPAAPPAPAAEGANPLRQTGFAAPPAGN